jgi:hypothetical protein
MDGAMLVYKTWRVIRRVSHEDPPYFQEYKWEGLFLFGFIPLVLVRHEVD